jgi:hypothetical protein
VHMHVWGYVGLAIMIPGRDSDGPVSRGAIAVDLGFACRLYGMVQAAPGITLLTKVILLVAGLFDFMWWGPSAWQACRAARGVHNDRAGIAYCLCYCILLLLPQHVAYM